jgi:hypothetical protein
MRKLLFVTLAFTFACQRGMAITPSQGTEVSGDPETAWLSFQTAVLAEDTDGVLAALSEGSRSWLAGGPAAPLLLVKGVDDASLAAFARRAGVEPRDLRAMPTADLIRVALRAELRRLRPAIAVARVLSTDVAGATALVTLGSPVLGSIGGRRLVMIAEDGAWKVDLPATRRLSQKRP